MSAGQPDGPGTRGGLTIGQVLGQLRDEFPDVTSSKVRFLEAQGLVTPERTPAGYRLFSAEDVERLRYVLTTQRDRFWPLKVIREALDALDRGLPDPSEDSVTPHRSPTLPAPPTLPTSPASPRSSDPALLRRDTLVPRGRVRLTGPELREASGIDKPLFSALESFGLLRADATGHFVGEAVDVAVAAKQLAEHGLEPRHLRPFRAAADREIGLVDQVLASRRGNGSREDLAAEILSACVALHTALVRTGLAR
ncbi:MAG TPA: MerR family transcriptional regulator [Intrasporangium sp.]|uniref:transcriptional regulator FtsR n=1 Tax=Intrasporangium sp. TaxID=1925024 RepID=UPI002B459A2A|nr:MerR family transcriptional regulator [Intrasporangium sp.]HKX68417.1 MerR family transcriptional regulator [Intrasporangium sp.]